MQGSKIKPRKVYAIRNEFGQLVRFYVDAVVQRRTENYGNPHDYQVTVEGLIQDGKGKKLIVEADKVLGPYEDYVELVEKTQREQEARKREDDERKATVHKLQKLLYETTGLPRPNDPTSYRQTFRTSSGYSIDISWEGIQPLIDALERLNVKEVA